VGHQTEVAELEKACHPARSRHVEHVVGPVADDIRKVCLEIRTPPIELGQRRGLWLEADHGAQPVLQHRGVRRVAVDRVGADVHHGRESVGLHRSPSTSVPAGVRGMSRRVAPTSEMVHIHGRWICCRTPVINTRPDQLAKDVSNVDFTPASTPPSRRDYRPQPGGRSVPLDGASGQLPEGPLTAKSRTYRDGLQPRRVVPDATRVLEWSSQCSNPLVDAC